MLTRSCRPHWTGGLVAAVTLVVALGGCASPPERTYAPRLAADAISPGLPMPEEGYRLLAEEQTVGRFPCTLAFAKLAPATDNSAGLVVAAPTPAEEGYWVDAFTAFHPIRDLVFLSPLSLKTYGNGLDGLLLAARRVGAKLLLVTAPNRFGANAAQVLGLLVETETGRPVATLRASAQFLDDEGNEQLVDDEEGDWRAYDAAYQAGRQFERYAVACLRAHVLADQSPPTTQPHRWTPLYPRVVPVVPVQPRPKPAAAPPTTQPAERESSAAPGHSAGPFEHAGHALAPPVEPEPTVPLRQRLKH